MKNYETTINDKRVMATAGGIARIRGSHRFTQPKVEFYPEGERGHTLVLEGVECTAGVGEADEVMGKVLESLGFKPISSGWEQRA